MEGTYVIKLQKSIMASALVKEFNNAWWTEVYNRVIGAVVFIDDASAECLHWEGGLFNLMTSGAVMVKTLSSFEVISHYLFCAMHV